MQYGPFAAHSAHQVHLVLTVETILRANMEESAFTQIHMHMWMRQGIWVPKPFNLHLLYFIQSILLLNYSRYRVARRIILQKLSGMTMI